MLILRTPMGSLQNWQAVRAWAGHIGTLLRAQ